MHGETERNHNVDNYVVVVKNMAKTVGLLPLSKNGKFA